MRSETADFYSMVVARERLHGQAHQWASLATYAQERLVYDKTLEYVPQGAHCLDWGCGNGHFSRFLIRSGYRTEAFSLHPIPPLLAGREDVIYKRGEKASPVLLPYPDAAFDAVFGVGVLEHVRDPGGDEAASLAELERILKPNGLLFIFHFPNRWSWLEWAKGLVGHRQHPRRYTREQFVSFLSGIRLKIIDEGRYHLLPRMALNRLPRTLSDSTAWCSVLDFVEDALSVPLRAICQNWYFILRKL